MSRDRLILALAFTLLALLASLAWLLLTQPPPLCGARYDDAGVDRPGHCPGKDRF
jgi:hypothetical protein